MPTNNAWEPPLWQHPFGLFLQWMAASTVPRDPCWRRNVGPWTAVRLAKPKSAAGIVSLPSVSSRCLLRLEGGGGGEGPCLSWGGQSLASGICHEVCFLGKGSVWCVSHLCKWPNSNRLILDALGPCQTLGPGVPLGCEVLRQLYLPYSVVMRLSSWIYRK